MDKIELKPCPFCGSINVSWTYDRHQGHGDCGYSGARFSCGNCVATGLSDYGLPSTETMRRAAEAWNTRVAPKHEFPQKVKIALGKPSASDEMIEKLVDKYKNMSLFEFLETLSK